MWQKFVGMGTITLVVCGLLTCAVTPVQADPKSPTKFAVGDSVYFELDGRTTQGRVVGYSAEFAKYRVEYFEAIINPEPKAVLDPPKKAERYLSAFDLSKTKPSPPKADEATSADAIKTPQAEITAEGDIVVPGLKGMRFAANGDIFSGDGKKLFDAATGKWAEGVLAESKDNKAPAGQPPPKAGDTIENGLGMKLRADEAAARQRAEALMAEAVKLYPKLSSTSGAGPNLAEAQSQKEAREKIESLYSEAIKEAPTFPAAYIARGHYWRMVHKPLNAQDDFERATKLPESPLEAWAELSAIASLLRDRVLAKKIADDAFTKASENGGPQGVPTLAIGQLAFRGEHWKRAIELANQALKNQNNPEFMEWMRIRGLSQLVLGNEAAAGPDLGLSQTSAGDEYDYKAKAANMTADRVLELARNYKKINQGRTLDLDMLDRAIELDPKRGDAYLERAEALWEIRKTMLEYRGKMRRHKDAVEDYRLAKVFTAEMIAADCDAAVKNGIDPAKVAVIRAGLIETRPLATFEFERYPYASLADLEDMAKNPKATPEELLDIARKSRRLAVLREEQIALYDLAVKRNPNSAAALFERAELRWMLWQEMRFTYAVLLREEWAHAAALGRPTSGGFLSESRLPGDQQRRLDELTAWMNPLRNAHDPFEIKRDCEQARKLGLSSPALVELINALEKR